MKKFQKKDNKGFSLVELIVVVAIMAVLLGVLVPTLVRNVEKSKHQKDIQALSEIRGAIEKALADERFSTIKGEITITPKDGSFTIDATSLAGFTYKKTGDNAAFAKEVCANLGGDSAESYSHTFTSKLSDTGTTIKFAIGNESVTGQVSSTKYGTEDLQDKAYGSNKEAAAAGEQESK